MQITTILKILGLLLMIFSLTLVPPILVDFIYHENAAWPFFEGLVVTFMCGMLFWVPLRHHHAELRTKDGFIIVALFWSALSLVGAFQFMMIHDASLSFIDALFESISGLTTTGSSVIPDLAALPHALLYYRQQLQFLGGLGIIILAVAILPMLGIGGMQLFRAEMTGPVKDTKLTPRIAETARAIWMTYLSLTLLCAAAYWKAGMTPFDAIGHSFATLSTGGYSTHIESFMYYNSPALKGICILFMILGGISFPLHYFVFKRRKPSLYFRDLESRTFLLILAMASFVTALILIQQDESPAILTPFIDSAFQVVSFMTTTGFVSAPYFSWPLFVPILLLFLGVIGGCAGSTSGGLKVIRVILLQKQGDREIKRLIHPHGEFLITLGGRTVPPRVIQGVWGFLATYILTFCVLLLLLLIAENDFLTAYSSLVTTITNTGPGLGKVTSDFHALAPFTKGVLCVAMLIGRLEIFTLLVLFSPDFWRS